MPAYIVDYAGIALAWILFISIPFLATGMFYRAWKGYQEMRQLRLSSARTEPCAASLRSSSNYLLVNAVCGTGLCIVFAGVVFYGLAFATWSGSTAILVWVYFAAMRILEKGRQSILKPS